MAWPIFFFLILKKKRKKCFFFSSSLSERNTGDKWHHSFQISSFKAEEPLFLVWIPLLLTSNRSYRWEQPHHFQVFWWPLPQNRLQTVKYHLVSNYSKRESYQNSMVIESKSLHSLSRESFWKKYRSWKK